MEENKKRDEEILELKKEIDRLEREIYSYQTYLRRLINLIIDFLITGEDTLNHSTPAS